MFLSFLANTRRFYNKKSAPVPPENRREGQAGHTQKAGADGTGKEDMDNEALRRPRNGCSTT
jgi:hypothetical protein